MTERSIAGIPPEVTVVVTCRERHRLTEAAIETIVRNAAMPMRLIYADAGAPDWLIERLAVRAPEWGLEIIRFDESLWPSQVRGRIAPMLDTKYAVFIDNDVLAAPGWLERLYECAEETGAGLVGPVYLWGEDGRSDIIHMAGGAFRAEETADGLVLCEVHRALNMRLSEVELRRRECDFVEFHCMLMRRELYRTPGIFDEDIVCVHENIHAAMTAKHLGYKIYLEPAARVTYLAYAPYALPELPLFRRRWSQAAGEASIRAFAARWNVIDDERSFGGVRDFLARHISEVDPVRASLQDEASQTPMQESDLRQTLTGLLEQAAAKGYTEQDINRIRNAHWLALLLSNGGYRACGRPFINHLAGTASVLVHYGFDTRLVLAGFLHSAYTHAPHTASSPEHTVDSVSRALGGKGTQIERLVADYTMRGERWRHLASLPDWRDEATMSDVDIAILSRANDIEMHLSGEVRATGRTDVDDGPALANIREICEILGVPGLAQEATLPHSGKAVPVLGPLENRLTASFRIEGGKFVPMVNSAFFQVRRPPPALDAKKSSA